MSRSIIFKIRMISGSSSVMRSYTPCLEIRCTCCKFCFIHWESIRLPDMVSSTMNKILNQFMYKPEEIAGGAPAKTVKSEVKNDGFDEDSPPPKSEGDDDEAMNTPPASSAPLAQSHDVKEENGTSSPDGDDDDDSLFGGDE